MAKLKICPFCKKEYLHLAQHIVHLHPSVMATLDEYGQTPGNDAITGSSNSVAKPLQVIASPRGSITELIREKLDIMLNIKIIEMLSKSPETSLSDISEMINPTPKKSLLEEVKQIEEAHALLHPNQENNFIDTGNEWANVAQAAIPVLKEMLSRKQPTQLESTPNVRPGKESDPGILKPLCLEIAGNTTEPVSDSKESGTTGNTEQQDNRKLN